MADVKQLFRDTPREEFFYRMGFQEGFRAARGDQVQQRALEATVRNARAQVDS